MTGCVTSRIPMPLHPPRTCCVNLGAEIFDPWTVIHFPCGEKQRSSTHHADVTLRSHLLRQKQRAVSKGGTFIFQGFEVETEKCCCAMCFCDIERGVNILKPRGVKRRTVYSTVPQVLKGFWGRFKLFLDPFISDCSRSL